MYPNPANAYRKTSKLALSPRGAEAEAFSKAARLLHQAKTGPFDYENYASALRFNQRLWTVIQADLGRDGMHLPAELRRDILNLNLNLNFNLNLNLSLSLYVDKQTIKALTDPKAEHLGALVEIDRTVARGLTPAA